MASAWLASTGAVGQAKHELTPYFYFWYGIGPLTLLLVASTVASVVTDSGYEPGSSNHVIQDSGHRIFNFSVI